MTQIHVLRKQKRELQYCTCMFQYNQTFVTNSSNKSGCHVCVHGSLTSLTKSLWMNLLASKNFMAEQIWMAMSSMISVFSTSCLLCLKYCNKQPKKSENEKETKRQRERQKETERERQTRGNEDAQGTRRRFGQRTE